MKNFHKSVTFKIGIIIILIEIVVLAVTGFFYINRFSAQIDERVKSRIELPGTLVARGLLSFGSVADQEVMADLVGEDLIDGLVIGQDQQIFHSLNPKYVRQDITAVPDIDPTWFDPNLQEGLLIETSSGLVSITPIRAFANEKSSFFVYIKVGTTRIKQEKQATGWLFILGSIFSVAITSLAIIYLFNSTIVIRIRELLNVLGKVEMGNLAARVDSPISSDEIGALQTGFNSMTMQLEEVVNTLEERVLERTKSLETVAEISRQVTNTLDLNEILRYLVNYIQTEFDFYHTHIYLVDEETNSLILVEDSGEVGQQLLEKRHRLPVGTGIVGTVASTKEYFVSNNVNQVENFVRNPLLPNTNSELAIPLRQGDRILGVLDIQSDKLDRFTLEEVSLMQSLANQVSPAIENASLMAETQRALNEVERLNRRLTREGWEEFSSEVTTSGYHFIGGTKPLLNPDPQAWLPPMSEAAHKKQLVKYSSPGNGHKPKTELAVPLVLRGEVIGVLGVKREETIDWAEEEVSAVETVANQVARALENARLSKEQEKTIVQLKEVDRLKSEFLTSMSHELRTPLNSIIGFADVLLQGIDGELNEMAMNDIRLIHNSGQHLLALINDILDISKIEAGKMELVREPLNVSEAFNEVLAASSSLVKDKPISIVLKAEETLPSIYADKLRFNQILLNLVSNAVKFTEEGAITIRAQTQDAQPGMMRISVIDTGIGIPPDKIDAVFDRFRQADSSTTRKYGGTGLGLAICKQLVEMHDGEIGLTSREGVGSTFYFTIPLADTVVAKQNSVTTSP